MPTGLFSAAGRDHPGVTRATGLFDADVFPEPCRDAEEIKQLLAE
jgi:hypothetical protein